MLLPKRNDDFIKELLKREEDIRLDFKLTISNSAKIAKTIVAFANTLGGKIAIGINDNKKIVGIDPEEELYMIKKAAEEFCIPPVPFEIEIFEIDYLDDEVLEEELYILLVNVPKSNTDHQVISTDQKRIRYQRIGDRNIPDQEI